MADAAHVAGAAARYEDWHDVFREFAAFETVGTEDVLAAALPLMRQTLEIHEAGSVAPLDGVDSVAAHRGRLFFGPGAGKTPERNLDAVQALQGMSGALDLDGGRRPATAADPVHLRSGPPAEPAHLLGYRAWEQAVGHHDALTDVFLLGQLAASLATGLDLAEPDALKAYAARRRALTELNPRLHPAVARMLARMTELDRRDREQDLAGAIAKLEGYRRLRLADVGARDVGARVVGARVVGARVDAEPEAQPEPDQDAEAAPLATAGADPADADANADADETSTEDAASAKADWRASKDWTLDPSRDPEAARRRAILAELRGRLYDLSKRNRLIYYRPTAGELDLTEASTPIVMRADAIRADQLFTLKSDAARQLLAGETVHLGDVVRFDEMAHAAPTLDRLRSDDRRDRAEFGLSQLRLIIGFLDWRNLKDDPDTPIRSPLLLLPVTLKKRRGVRDSYELKANGAEAEVNPTLRRYLQLLYGVDLPRTVDLEKADAVAALHRELAAEIARTEPGVSLDLFDQPDLAQLHRRAARRVDLYKRRSKPAGAAARRRYGDLDYSYQRDAYRPLGIQLYERFVAPPDAPTPPDDRTLGLEAVEPVHMAGAAAATPPDGASASAGAPYAWAMDLCALTLANLNYRRMSLVRDFDALVSGAAERLRDAGSVAFDEVFADRPKPLAPPPASAGLAERAPVTVTDPTQDAAVARARLGESFVIQGPPGAGKSQTIANLIADQVAFGRRILFVCEKRAAIDVVLRRLEAIGLAPLCARVHDAQGDKKAFVQELRALFEAWAGVAAPEAVADDDAQAAEAETARKAALAKMEGALAQLAALDRDMRASLEGAPTHELLTRAAAARGPMTLDDAARARAPSLREWRQGRDAARAVADALARAGAEPILARHPARFVSAEACADPKLFERLTSALDAVGAHLEKMAEAAPLALWDGPAPLSALFAQIDYAHRLAPVALAGRLRVFDVQSQLAIALKRRVDDLAIERAELTRAEARTHLWEDKLSELEVDAALALARKHESSWFGWLSKPWREARAEVERRCRLEGLAIKPRIQDLLEDLQAEHEASAQVGRRLREIAEDLGLQDGAAALQIVEERDARAPAEGPAATPLLEACVVDPGAVETRIASLAALKPAADAARAALADCFDGLDALSAEQAFSALAELRAQRDALPAFGPALRALAAAPATVRAALRRIDAEVDVIERAILDVAVDRAFSTRPALREASGASVDAARASIQDAMGDYLGANAVRCYEAARGRFLEHLALTQRLELELPPEEQNARRDFVEARRELERELAKSQRFRSIRELLAGPAGLFIRDLKPVWMMSPLSVADVLPLETGLFDLVIFDEASQVTAEAAAPSLFRAGQAIVVGDEKQMPPSQFFAARSPGGEDGLGESASGDDVDANAEEAALLDDLDADSLLAQAGRTLPSTLLGWHYRSRAEELIAFSNAVFYGGKLITIPSPRRRRQAEPIAATSPEDGAERWRETLERSVSFHHTAFGRFEQRRNVAEAAYVAEMVRALLVEKSGKTMGVVAFSETQSAEIERALDRLAKKDAKFRRVYEAELEREVDGAFAGLFVKNLENVQGDERDLIIVSVGYAPDETGKFRLNFGPVNRDGGERRLNVLFTRAREHLALISSVTSDDIGSVSNDGALCLKGYLAYAAAASVGDDARVRRVLAMAGREAETATRRA